MSFLNYKPLKLPLRMLLADHTVAMVTCCVTKMITACSPMVGKYFDTTMSAASSNEEWLKIVTTHQNLSAGNCFEPP